MHAFEDPGATVCLVGLTGELAGRRFLVRAGSILGRSASATVFLPDPKLQRSHCRLVGAEGRLRLEPCGQSASLAVNGQARRTHLLEFGDTVRIGRFELRVEPGVTNAARPPTARAGSSFPAEKSPHVAGAARADLRAAPIHGQGAVLALQWRGLPSSVAPAEMLVRLRRLVEGHVRATGGQWFVGDPAAPRIAWPASPALGPLEAYARDDSGHPAFSTAARLQWGAYLLARRQGTGLCSIGWSEGNLAWTKAGHFWGEAVERAVLSALEGAVDEIRRADPRGSVRVWGKGEPTRGRKERFLLACPATLWRDGEIASDAMLRSAAWDPVNSAASCSLLCRIPLEPDVTYRIEVPGASGREIEATVAASAPLNNRLGCRVRLSGNSTLPHLLATLGVEVLGATGSAPRHAA